MIEQTFHRIAFRFPRKEDKHGVNIDCTPKKSRMDKKPLHLIVARRHRDPIQNMIAGALQADTAHIIVPAAGNSITVIAIDNHETGKIHGQRLDSISRLINLGSKADLYQQTYQRKQARATESTPRRHPATAKWAALGAGSQRRYSRATPRRMMRVSFQRCSTAHESRDAEG